jgi:lysophospholipase L1-like esterase
LRGGVSGTTLAQWSASGSLQRAALVQAIRAAGGVDAILIQVGRNDAFNLLVPNTEGQIRQIRALIASLRIEASVPSATIFIGSSQDMLGGNIEQHLQLGRQRLAEVTVANSDPNVRYGYSTYDLPTIDNIHQTEKAQQTSGTRFAAQVIAWVRGTGQQRGPQITDASFVSQTQTHVALRQGAGTDVLPAIGIDGFQMLLGGSTNELAILTAERINPTTVRLTHEARNNRPVRVAYALDHDVSDTTCLRDNSPYQLPCEPYASASM